MANDGIYRPLRLDRKEIRLLLVKAGQSHEPLQCEIQYTSLDDAAPTPYETVSYVWGDPTDETTVIVDGQEVNVPRSSHNVLRRMRSSTSDRTLWIDAVCINQRDVAERNRQVALMAEIYAGTARNLVWLGEEDGDGETERAYGVVERVLGDAEREIGGLGGLVERVVSTGPVDPKHNLFSSTGMGVEVQTVRPLIRLFDRPWFGRLWVYQEVGLAPESLCCCGPYEIVLRELLQAAIWLYHKKTHLSLSAHDEYVVRNAAMMWQTADEEYHTRFADVDISTPMLNLPGQCRNLLASEPRDRVFGLLGLYSKLHPGQSIPPLLAPDYRKPVAKVFTDATRFTMLELGNLDCFNYIWHSPDPSLSIEGAPSWMPAFDHPNYEDQETDNFRLFEACGTHGGFRPQPSPSGVENDAAALFTQGIKVDTVAKIWAPIRRTTTLAALLDMLEDIQNELIRAGRTNARAMMATTLAADTNYQREALGVHAATQGFEDWRSCLKKHAVGPHLQVPFHSHARDWTHGSPIAMEYSLAFATACINRSVYLTSNGRLGIGPESVRLQHVVAVLWGCKWPVVLRALGEESRYSLIGLSYLHGVMEGQAVTGYEAMGDLDSLFYLV